MKRILALVIAVFFLFALTSCGQSSSDYKSKLIVDISNKGTTTVGEIFDFEFDRAYIFDYLDGYLDGAWFVEKYDLDISIDKVEAGKADYIQRIVFVDKEGDFVYLFECIMTDVLFAETGVIIYPETIIERVPSQEILTIHFEGVERYAPEIDY